MHLKASFALVCIVAGISLAACGPSQAELDAQATKVAADIFATQTAEAPPPTPTPTLTPTPTETPTPTPVPTPTFTPTPSPVPTEPPYRLEASEDKTAFLRRLATQLEENDWEIKTLEPNYIGIEKEGGLRILIEYIYHSPSVNRLIIHVIATGLGQDNLTYNALQEFNRLNNAYNLTKLYVDEDGDLWFDDVYAFGKELDVESLSDYLEWYEESLFDWIQEWLLDYIG